MIHWMFNCKEVSEKVSLAMDASLPIHHRMMITMHLLICKYCNRFRKQLMILRNAIRLEKLPEDDPARSGSLSNATRERIKKALREVSH
jgi:hypothetical protein